MTSDLYHQQLLEAARESHNKGVLEDADKTVSVVNASCGDKITVFVKFSPDGSTVEKIRWQGEGCIISQASMSMVSGHIEGLTLAEIKNLDEEKLLGLVGLPSIAPGRKKCLLIGLEAVKKSVV